MLFKYVRYIILLIILTATCTQGFTQSAMSISNMQNVKVNQLSDEQITQLWKKLRIRAFRKPRLIK